MQTITRLLVKLCELNQVKELAEKTDNELLSYMVYNVWDKTPYDEQMELNIGEMSGKIVQCLEDMQAAVCADIVEYLRSDDCPVLKRSANLIPEMTLDFIDCRNETAAEIFFDALYYEFPAWIEDMECRKFELYTDMFFRILNEKAEQYFREINGYCEE